MFTRRSSVDAQDAGQHLPMRALHESKNQMMFILVQLDNRRYAIFDTVAKVYYCGKKKDLIKRMKELK